MEDKTPKLEPITSTLSPNETVNISDTPGENSSMQLTAEDVLGILDIRYAKCEITESGRGQRWNLRLTLQRQGEADKRLVNYSFVNAPNPFFLGCQMPRKEKKHVDFYHTFEWRNTFHEKLKNPSAYYFGIRGSYPEVPLHAGKRVVLLWAELSAGDGWDPRSDEYVQRVVLELTKVASPND